MPDFQTFIAILTALLVFLAGVFLNYDTHVLARGGRGIRSPLDD
jgi:hypothetical protein